MLLSDVINIDEDLQALNRAQKNHYLELDLQKSKAILFGRKRTRNDATCPIKLNIDAVPAPLLDSAINLGVYIEADVGFHGNVSNEIKASLPQLKIDLFSLRSTSIGKNSDISP